MISVSVPVPVFKILGGLSVDNKVAVSISVKSADNVQRSGLAAARWSEYGDNSLSRKLRLIPFRAWMVSEPAG